jgi:hypothetical protein
MHHLKLFESFLKCKNIIPITKKWAPNSNCSYLLQFQEVIVVCYNMQIGVNGY